MTTQHSQLAINTTDYWWMY